MPRRGTKLSPEAAVRQADATAKWHLAHYENMSVCLRKGKRDAYKQLASIRGTSVSAMIQGYLDEQCRIEGIQTERTED